MKLLERSESRGGVDFCLKLWYQFVDDKIDVLYCRRERNLEVAI